MCFVYVYTYTSLEQWCRLMCFPWRFFLVLVSDYYLFKETVLRILSKNHVASTYFYNTVYGVTLDCWRLTDRGTQRDVLHRVSLSYDRRKTRRSCLVGNETSRQPYLLHPFSRDSHSEQLCPSIPVLHATKRNSY